MGETVDESEAGGSGGQPLSERFLDVFVFLPTGLAVTVADELPRLAERGRERFGMQVNSARAIGQFAVVAGQRELKKRTESLRRPGASGAGVAPSPDPTAPAPSRLRTIPYPPDPVAPEEPEPVAAPAARTPTGVDAHVPDVASLAIPGFDTLSASQVVQRLDGLSRTELVAVRAYETSSRGRRTILSRVDQLLDERS
jgi:hypothetical protein